MHTSLCDLRSSGTPKVISTHLILQDVAQGVPIFAGLPPIGRGRFVYVLFVHGSLDGVKKKRNSGQLILAFSP